MTNALIAAAAQDAARIRYAPATELAVWIRADLKREFPRVKFSVRSSFYSMGSSVDVNWTDGPTCAQVDRVIGKYERKTFDGRDDSTGNRGSFVAPTGETVNASAWVSTSRDLSEAADAAIKALLVEQSKDATTRGDDYWPLVTRTAFTKAGTIAAFVTVKR